MQNENEKKGNIIFGVVVVTIMAFGIIMLLQERKTPLLMGNPDHSLKFDTTVAITNFAKEITTWNYLNQANKMDGQTSFLAQVNSTNTVQFKPPYDGGSSFVFCVQKLNKKLSSVYLGVTKGQFMGSTLDDKKARIKFDNEAPFYVSISKTSDLQSNVIFLHPAQKIIQKLLKSKKMIIESEFYENGDQLAEFDVKDLIWNH